MGIDGIGKGGNTPKVDSSSGATSVKGIEGERFELSTEGVEQTQGAGLLEQVQRGEVGLDAYLDVRVNDAVGHLEGRLSPENRGSRNSRRRKPSLSRSRQARHNTEIPSAGTPQEENKEGSSWYRTYSVADVSRSG